MKTLILMLQWGIAFSLLFDSEVFATPPERLDLAAIEGKIEYAVWRKELSMTRFEPDGPLGKPVERTSAVPSQWVVVLSGVQGIDYATAERVRFGFSREPTSDPTAAVMADGCIKAEPESKVLLLVFPGQKDLKIEYGKKLYLKNVTIQLGPEGARLAAKSVGVRYELGDRMETYTAVIRDVSQANGAFDKKLIRKEEWKAKIEDAVWRLGTLQEQEEFAILVWHIADFRSVSETSTMGFHEAFLDAVRNVSRNNSRDATKALQEIRKRATGLDGGTGLDFERYQEMQARSVPAK
jgi:hypothetical protein